MTVEREERHYEIKLEEFGGKEIGEFYLIVKKDKTISITMSKKQKLNLYANGKELTTREYVERINENNGGSSPITSLEFRLENLKE
jgi:hypothetical protein